MSTENALAMLNTMAQMQDEHNALVHPQWRDQGHTYYRAIWVECAEMLDHFGWKWWKKQDADLDQVKLELVDIWHFGLSEMLRSGPVDAAIAAQLSEIQAAHTDLEQDVRAENFRLAIEQLAASSLASKSFDLSAFKSAMASLPMQLPELYGMYIGKNILNRFRQNNGYKSGEYRKLWQGREDNEHLVELLEELSGVVEGLPEKLYAGLEARYTA
jgi:hypothetical protein